MYREKIDKFIDAHKTEMLEDIAELCKIDSTKGFLPGRKALRRRLL